MADIKWIKITTDVFNDEKILLIESLPDADSIIVIWFKLLTLAGNQNNNGIFMLNDKMPYTEEMLATIFRRNVNTVRLALETFQNFGMVEVVNNAYAITNWEKHQNVDSMEKIREQTRERVARHRKKQLEIGCNVTSNVTVTQGNAIDKDKIREDKEKDNNNICYQDIINLYNSICISFSKVKTLSDARKKTIKARLNTYSMEELKTVFEKAEASDFLKGKNNRNWMANFDWMLKDANFTKILDGNYDTKTSGKEQKNDAGGKTASNEKGYVQQLVEQGYTGEFEGF